MSRDKCEYCGREQRPVVPSERCQCGQVQPDPVSSGIYTIAHLLGVYVLEQSKTAVRVRAPTGFKFLDAYGCSPHELNLTIERAAEILNKEGQLIRCDCVICEAVRRTGELRKDAMTAVDNLITACGGNPQTWTPQADDARDAVKQYVCKLFARGSEDDG